jgi:hypothetical protein
MYILIIYNLQITYCLLLIYLIIIAKMKIIRLILLLSAIVLISSKTETNKATISAEKNQKAKQNYSENPISGVAVPNDNYLLQQVEVNKFF